MKAITLSFVCLCVSLLGCVEKIPGDPAQVVAHYVEGVQKGDHDTLLRLNHLTARRLKYFDMSELPQDREVEERFREQQKKEYDEAPLDFTPGIQWAERHFFPRSSHVTIGKPRRPTAVLGDPVNADYEKAVKVIVTVKVRYPDQSVAPRYQGRSVSTAEYDCLLSKIREGKNVRSYSHDDRWFVNGFILNTETVQFADEGTDS